jgi:hypothetical protein
MIDSMKSWYDSQPIKIGDSVKSPVQGVVSAIPYTSDGWYHVLGEDNQIYFVTNPELGTFEPQQMELEL